MPSNFRIPKARLDGAYGAVMTRVAQRMWGQVPDTAHVLWHNKPVLKAVFEERLGLPVVFKRLASRGQSFLLAIEEFQVPGRGVLYSR